MTKNIKILILVSLLFQNGYSQNKRQYSGEYGDGKAIYQYYENENYERVFDGLFEYSGKLGIYIKGLFKNNNKIGLWNYAKKYKLKNEELSIIVNGKYENNIKNGLWTFSKFYTYNGKIENYKNTYNVKNDTIIGKINLPDLQGEFDDNGNFIGKWRCIDNGFEYIAEFENNILTKFIYREQKNDGKVYLKYTPRLDTLKTSTIKTYNEYEKYSKIEFDKLYKVNKGNILSSNDQLIGIFRNFFEKLEAHISRSQFNTSFVQLENLRISTPEFLIENNDFKKEEVIDNNIYLFEELDKLPEFAGGIQNFKKFVIRNFEMPKTDETLSGNVSVEFVILKNGDVGNFKIIKDLGYDCGNELIKAIKKSPKWMPGQKNGVKVNSKHQIEININKTE